MKMPVPLEVSGTCHCGTVQWTMKDPGPAAVDCNCSLCRRLGSLWIYSTADKVTIASAADATFRYIQGDRKLAYHICRTCGCATHWESLYPVVTNRAAVNLRMAEPDMLARWPVRRFDGADSWTFLD